MWHLGVRMAPKGRRRHWWVNHWLRDPCSDLALPFELGTRAYHHGFDR